MNKLLMPSRMALLLGSIVAVVFAWCGDINKGALIFLSSLVMSLFLRGLED